MTNVKIRHNTLIFVGDGRRALFLRNEGDATYLNLRVEKVFEDRNPSAHEQGSDRPGRISKGPHSNQRSAVEAVDWHLIEKHRFVKEVATRMEDVVRQTKTPAIVIVAPPRALADIREALHSDTRAHIIAEIDKDLTKHSVGDIERHLTAEL